MNATIKTNKNIGKIQIQLITFVWILIFAIPLLFGKFRFGIVWSHIFKIWIEYGFLFIVFLINRFLLFPILFLKGRRTLYFLSVVAALVLLVYTSYIFGTSDNNLVQEQHPISQNRDMPFPPPGGPPPDHHYSDDVPEGDPFRNNNAPADQTPPSDSGENAIPPFANLLILGILIIGFDTGLIFSVKWLKAEQNKLILEKENMENKMAFLQNQISPHFFMNTLNNIHALVDINTDEAKEAIIRLSQMMAYMLYESQTDKISLQKEIEFIKSYVELMRLRFTDDIDIKLDIDEDLPRVSIPPLLTISFIENAFKHGISYEETSFVHIVYRFANDKITFEVSNTNHSKKDKSENSGIGLQNAKNRLALIYKDNYKLDIDQFSGKIFTVKLNLPL
jgi:two-component sensor histidine kinase